MLDYPLLAALAAVVREGSFGRAARALHLTPSAVSQRVQLLSERVGAVLGVGGDVVHCHATTPAMSSLHYPGRTIGLAAAELLGRMIRGENVDPNTYILIPPKKLVVRESTGQVEHPDMVVTAALRWLRSEGGMRAPGVMEVCRALGVSREILRQKLSRALGKSPKQVIAQLRADLIAEHLLRRAWTVDHAAHHFGFSSSDDLCRFFKRIKGCTIGEWRRERAPRSS